MSSRPEQLKKKVENLNKLDRNWEQRVLGFQGVSNSSKNSLIKNTKVRLLKKFLETRPLPKNWENRVRRNFSNVNNKNVLINKIKKEKSSPKNRDKKTYVKSLKHMILSTLRRKNNQPNYINVGNRRVHLNRLELLHMKPSAKNILKRLKRNWT